MYIKLVVVAYSLLQMSLCSGKEDNHNTDYHHSDLIHETDYSKFVGEAEETSILRGLHKIPFADWESLSRNILRERLYRKRNEKRAKNVIFFVGDGLGISGSTVARFHKSQLEHITVDKVQLSWEKFLDSALAKIYTADAGVPDSGGTATAFMCGIKTRVGVLGVDESVQFWTDCSLYSEENHCKSALQYAKEAGKMTGIVTNTRLTDGTPAAAYAHTSSRFWEADTSVPVQFRESCRDNAHQLIYRKENQDINVLFGGGRENFFLETELDAEYPNSTGRRQDINLVKEWIKIKQEGGYKDGEFQYIYNQSAFDTLDTDKTKFVLGGRIDHAHHENIAHLASIETWTLSDAVQKAVDMTDKEDTLIVVTSDHSHPLTVNGYTHLDSPIYGSATNSLGMHTIGGDGLPMQAVSYANGPGAADHAGPNNTRRDLSDVTPEEYNDPYFRQDTMVERPASTHSGEDVTVHARGPWAHLFTGVVEQHYLATAMMFAQCTKHELNDEHCRHASVTPQPSSTSQLNICPSFIWINLISLTLNYIK